jgi:hypothetical protein
VAFVCLFLLFGDPVMDMDGAGDDLFKGLMMIC